MLTLRFFTVVDGVCGQVLTCNLCGHAGRRVGLGLFVRQLVLVARHWIDIRERFLGDIFLFIFIFVFLLSRVPQIVSCWYSSFSLSDQGGHEILWKDLEGDLLGNWSAQTE